MVLTASADTEQPVAGRLRRMDPGHDLGAMAELIATAFGDEMDSRGRAAIRELRWMARLSPFVWWWAQADPSFREAYNGFVWEEPATGKLNRRQVVGNANLNRAPGNRRRWVVCNVVVHEDYRRRGIARQLVDATISEAQLLGAEGVVLQVYEDNLAAYRLYADLGFQTVAGETDLRLAALRPVALVDAPGYHLRPWRPQDGQAVTEIAKLAIPAPIQWLKPIRSGDYRPDWSSRAGQWLATVFGGRRTYRLIVAMNDEPVGLLTVEASLRSGDHVLGLLVHPRHRGLVEPMLVSRALYILAALPGRPVRTTVTRDHSAALKVLGEHGFREQRTLLTMSYSFPTEKAPRYGQR